MSQPIPGQLQQRVIICRQPASKVVRAWKRSFYRLVPDRVWFCGLDAEAKRLLAGRREFGRVLAVQTEGTQPGSDTPKGIFSTTHWSAVLEAQKGDSPAACAALEELCRTYWYPLYAFVRRQGHSPEEAEDLTQSFFARLLEKDYVKLADPARGKFRSFLLFALKNFLTNEWARSMRQKRGGGHLLVSWDQASAERRYQTVLLDELSPEKVFEKQWAITLLEQVLARLTQEQVDAGRERFFGEVKGWLWGDKGTVAYAELAGQLGLTEAALKSAVHRLRLRYRELLREEIGRTVATPLEIQEELEGLMTILRS